MRNNTALLWIVLPVLILSFCTTAWSALDEGLEAFFEVCRAGSSEDVSRALQAVSDIDAGDEKGMTALMYAATWNNDPKVVAVLVDAGSDVNASDIYGTTVLMFAAGWNENPDVLAVLVDAGADIEARDEEGMTALMMAAWNNANPDVIMFLLESGADPAAETQDGETAFYFIEENPELDDTEAYWALHDAVL